MPRARELLTADLFEIPQAPLPSGGSLNFDAQLRHALSDALKACNFPLNYVAAFEVATESFALTQLLAEKRGCKLLVGEEALLAELGKIEREEQTLRVRKQALKRYMG